MKTIYISGKISDDTKEKEAENLRLFFHEEDKLVAQGFDVINPAHLVIANGTWEQYMAIDLHLIILHRPSIWLLPNWRESRGARLEVAFAEQLGLEVLNK